MTSKVKKKKSKTTPLNSFFGRSAEDKKLMSDFLAERDEKVVKWFS